MFKRFANSFNACSKASANGFGFACSSFNQALILTMDTVFAVSVFVIEHLIISLISIIIRSFGELRPYPVSEA